MRHLQAEVSAQQNKLFGKNSKHAYGLFHHLVKEVGELGESYHDLKKMSEELADCVILLIGIADAYDVDLELAVQKKMSENLNRKWKKADKHGVIEHIKNEK
jgi:NTP pyrophosphatase (non-canonical NTP hydrolase)